MLSTHHRVLLLLLFVTLACVSCCQRPQPPSPDLPAIDLAQIKKRGTLVAAIDYNSTNYFIYRGKPMGFQYELLKKFAEELNVQLKLEICFDLSQVFTLLNNNAVDIVALNLNQTEERLKMADFTNPYSYARHVLVQRMPDDWYRWSLKSLERSVIRQVDSLAFRTVFIPTKSSFHQTLQKIEHEHNLLINIRQIDNIESERLINMVAAGVIDYAVCDESVAQINKQYYPNIDIRTALSEPKGMRWAVRKNSPELKSRLNTWIEANRKSSEYQFIYDKYYKHKLSALRRKNSGYLSTNSNQISVYDDLIRVYSEKIDWDWRLLASLIYQESQFDPCAASWAGAFGLMQLMPETALQYGVDSLSPPEAHINAGIQLIQWLDEKLALKVADEDERINFVLASYNGGIGHVLDGIKLAEKYGKNPAIWTGHVDYFVLNKSYPKYYNDPVVEFGICRGKQTYDFVQAIRRRLEHYRNAYPD